MQWILLHLLNIFLKNCDNKGNDMLHKKIRTLNYYVTYINYVQKFMEKKQEGNLIPQVSGCWDYG